MRRPIVSKSERSGTGVDMANLSKAVCHDQSDKCRFGNPPQESNFQRLGITATAGARVGTGMLSLVPASNVALTVEGLCKTYGKTVAVGPLSFSLTVGSTTALLGGNGAGKTTTIGMIMGLIEPTSGSVRVVGHDMAHE